MVCCIVCLISQLWVKYQCLIVDSFLLDRLLRYEKLEDSSDDTDATASSDSELETKEPLIKKFGLYCRYYL